MSLDAAARQALKYRAQRVIARPIPASICQGSADQARAYKECAAKVAGYLRTGLDAKRAATSVARLECMQGVAP